jgi:8-oxo-dGTP diphosphatase
LTKWLDESRPNMLPHYSSHTLGVGGVVIHPDQDKILLIKEKFVSNAHQNWKFPGGLVDQGETLDEAAVREVFEETGI